MSRRFVVLLAVVILGGFGLVVATERSAANMAEAAGDFLDSLTPEQRWAASFDFAVDDRTRWHFIPAEVYPRAGLALRDMTARQRMLAHNLLKSALSERGYLTATQIMQLDTIVLELERAGYANEGVVAGVMLERDPLDYIFAVFGVPESKAPWMWRVEGHHVSLHFTVVGGALVASTPSFFGSNPAEVPNGPSKGLRVLAAEEDIARSLVLALDGPQRADAIISGVAPNDILTLNVRAVDPLAPAGVVAADMNDRQRGMLMQLIDVYASKMASDIAEDRMTKLRRAGVEKIAFAWAGATERGAKHYYRVQGPTFLIEYDNAQNDGNHIHAIWRDFNGDFGRDLLREHLQAVAHP